MSESLENLVNLLTTLADPAKFKSQLAQLREAMDGAAAAKKAQQDLEVNRHGSRGPREKGGAARGRGGRT
jgi:hypothetical protein